MAGQTRSSLATDVDPGEEHMSNPGVAEVRGGFWGAARRLLLGRRGIPLPPAHLMVRVHGQDANLADNFLMVGRKSLEDIQAALNGIGKDWPDFKNVLDLGCGCGRLTRWLVERYPAMNLEGCDTDPDAIRWCRRNLQACKFDVTAALPPLPYAEAQFDLVFLVSIFTHLNEDYQGRWLAELQRITRPGGIVLITVHGPKIMPPSSAEMAATFQRKGFLFLDQGGQGVFPSWYGTSFQSEEYTANLFGRYFKIRAHLPNGLHQFQDIVLLERDASVTSTVAGQVPFCPKMDPSITQVTGALASEASASKDLPEVCLELAPKQITRQLDGFHQMSLLPADGRILLRSHGNDPFCTLPAIQPGRAERYSISVDLTSPADTVFQVYYTTPESPHYTPELCQSCLVLKGRNKFQIKIHEPRLAGKLRIDPGLVSGDYEIHSLQVRCSGRPVQDVDEGSGLPVPPKHLADGVGGGYVKVGRELALLISTVGELKPTERVLEVGCGCGRVAGPLTRYLVPEGCYEGMDIVAESIEWCTANITPRCPHFKFRHANIFNKYYNPKGKIPGAKYSFPYADGAFDLVFLTSVFTHMLPPDVEQYTREIARVTRPGGRCLVTFFLLNEESRALCKAGKTVFGYHPVDAIHALHMPSQPEAAVQYDEQYVRELLEKNGLAIQMCRYGTWCGRKLPASLQNGQDLILASRK